MIRWNVVDERVLEEDELAFGAALGELEDEVLGARDELGRLALALPAELRDLAAGADQAAQRRRLADDLGVVAGVRARRDDERELVQPDTAADLLELAALLELVRERDRVDRLVLRVERERRAVDLRVRLAVEVGRVEDLAHRRDRERRDHHRPENGLLSFEILRGDRARTWSSGRGRGCRDGGESHALRFQQARSRVARCWYVHL